MSAANAPGGMSAAFCRDVASSGRLLGGLLLAGLLSCNSLLGIGEASLQCDVDPCATAGASAAGDARNDGEASADAGRVSAAGGPFNGDGAGGVPADLGSAESRDGIPVQPTAPPGGGAASSASGGGAASSASGGGASSGGASGGGASSGGMGGGAVPAGNAGAPSDPVGGGGAALCGGGDDCGVCLCDNCESQVDACTATPGCFEIVACARLNNCFGLDCYCGSADPIACATTGAANGPCLDAALAAPGSRLPTLANPSAGPAADAALEIANCTALSCAINCND